MKKIFKYAPLFLVCLTAPRCTQTYLPPPIANPAANLVVEGFINNGSDSTIFTLSRTVSLAVTPAVTPELNAAVSVQGADNSNYPLGSVGNGVYGAALPPLNPNVSYRLYITTSGGKQYASDYVPLVANPPIDSINWVRNNTGIQIYANTHDPTGKALYYLWDYEETWEFRSPFFATLQFVDDTIANYSPNTISTCWKYDNSTSVLLTNTTHLSQDLVYEMPLVLIPLNSQQLSIEYSIFVRQYVLDLQAFTWWSTLQNNTENIGSIFGVQPATNAGNLHCLTDSSETVVGYVSGGNIQSQRIFITNAQVFPWAYISSCSLQNTRADSFQYYAPDNFLLVDWDPFRSRVDFSNNYCVDCTLTGTNVRPPFWQ
jgi:Domain of unknown function (DUF4249)